MFILRLWLPVLTLFIPKFKLCWGGDKKNYNTETTTIDNTALGADNGSLVSREGDITLTETNTFLDGGVIDGAFEFAGNATNTLSGTTQDAFELIDGIVTDLFSFVGDSQQLNNDLAVEGFNIAGQTVVGSNFSTASTQTNIINKAMYAAAAIAAIALITKAYKK